MKQTKSLLGYRFTFIGITSLMAMLGLASCANHKIEKVEPKAFAELIGASDIVLLDVRTAEEYKEEHIAGAININQGQGDFIAKAKEQLPSNKTIALYCLRGRRAESAARRLAAEGYYCLNLDGGINAWKAAGLPTVLSVGYEVDEFKTVSGKIVRFHALMHSCIRIEYDGYEIEIDPVSSLGDRTVDFTSMPKADLILITHEHPDHYDEATIRLLSTQQTRLIMNGRCAEMWAKTNPAIAAQAISNGDKIEVEDGIMVEAVPAYNTTEGHTQFHPKGRDNGYILTLDSLRIYIAGDTEVIPEMEHLGDIDIAFLPCNQPFTMTTKQLVSAAKVIRPRVLFPYHYGQTDLMAVSLQLEGEGIDLRIRHYE